MGIKDRIVRVAGKAGDAVAKVSSLSPEQLNRVQEKRERYISDAPSVDDPSAVELTHRLIAACGVEIHNAYLPQISDLYAPVDPSVEYGGKFDSNRNIRFGEITKWVVDPEEDSLEKLGHASSVGTENDGTARSADALSGEVTVGENDLVSVSHLGKHAKKLGRYYLIDSFKHSIYSLSYHYLPYSASTLIIHQTAALRNTKTKVFVSVYELFCLDGI